MQHRPIIIQLQVCLRFCRAPDGCLISSHSSTFADYIAFSNSMWAVAPAVPSSAWPVSTTDVSLSSTSTAAPQKLAALADGSFSQNPLRPAVIGLGAGCVGLLLALVAVLAVMASRRRRNSRVRTGPVRSYPYTTPYDPETLASRRSTDKY